MYASEGHCSPCVFQDTHISVFLCHSELLVSKHVPQLDQLAEWLEVEKCLE